MTTPTADTPLYNHPLPEIERWLQEKGCQQDSQQRHYWKLDRSDWQAELWLEREEVTVRYLNAGEDGRDIHRAFPYSLSRQDVEDAVFSGP
jgi:hypothetical protein